MNWMCLKIKGQMKIEPSLLIGKFSDEHPYEQMFAVIGWSNNQQSNNDTHLNNDN